MSKQFGINMALAFLWIFLNKSYTEASFIVGFALGAIIIGLLVKFSDFKYFYLERFLRLAKLFFVFLYKLYVSCFQVFCLILSPNVQLKPGIIRMEVNLPTDFQLVLLASIINTTPGTLTLDISADKRVLYIHALNIDSADAIVDDIRSSFEDNIREIWE